jgi:hypothetical protein
MKVSRCAVAVIASSCLYGLAFSVPMKPHGKGHNRGYETARLDKDFLQAMARRQQNRPSQHHGMGGAYDSSASVSSQDAPPYIPDLFDQTPGDLAALRAQQHHSLQQAGGSSSSSRFSDFASQSLHDIQAPYLQAGGSSSSSFYPQQFDQQSYPHPINQHHPQSVYSQQHGAHQTDAILGVPVYPEYGHVQSYQQHTPPLQQNYGLDQGHPIDYQQQWAAWKLQQRQQEELEYVGMYQPEDSSSARNYNSTRRRQHTLHKPEDLVWEEKKPAGRRLIAEIVSVRLGLLHDEAEKRLRGLTYGQDMDLKSRSPEKIESVLQTMFPEFPNPPWMLRMSLGQSESIVERLFEMSGISKDVIRNQLRQSALQADDAINYVYAADGFVAQLGDQLLLPIERDENGTVLKKGVNTEEVTAYAATMPYWFLNLTKTQQRNVILYMTQKYQINLPEVGNMLHQITVDDRFIQGLRNAKSKIEVFETLSRKV